MPWTTRDMPDQTGRTAIVTGANSGIGREAAKALAAAGAHVVLACRDPRRGAAAEREIRRAHPDAALELAALDLASLASIRDFAKGIADRHERLDLLVNNAGVMAIPRRTTVDGFEMQLGTNHLGHFALTGLLLPWLIETPGSRVVNVSSTAHRIGRMNFDDLQGKRFYSRWLAYGQSKLANLLFTVELQRRLVRGRHDTISVACHPGLSATNLQSAGPKMDGLDLVARFAELGTRFVAQDAAMGALPTLYAATADEVDGGDYIGPDGAFEASGHPTWVGAAGSARDRASAKKLWDASEALTGVRFEL